MRENQIGALSHVRRAHKTVREGASDALHFGGREGDGAHEIVRERVRVRARALCEGHIPARPHDRRVDRPCMMGACVICFCARERDTERGVYAILADARTHARTHTHTHIRTHAQAHAHTHTRIRTHASGTLRTAPWPCRGAGRSPLPRTRRHTRAHAHTRGMRGRSPPRQGRTSSPHSTHA